MLGMGLATVALLMVPLGFALAWWIVRQLEQRSGDRRRRTPPPQARSAAHHPSARPARHRPLDDAPAEVIAALAQRMPPSLPPHAGEPS